MRILLEFDGHKFAKWIVTVLSSGWILGASWFVFMQPAPVFNSYVSQQSQVAKCRSLPTSDARYQCTSQLMLAKDNALFNRSLLIVLPPLGLMIVYVGVMKLVIAHRDRVKKHAALIASRKRMAAWRRHLAEVKAKAAAVQSENAFAAPGGRPSATPPHPARTR